MTTPIVKYPIVHIAVKQLSVVWVQAQRPYNDKWATHIADNLDPDKFEPIVVTKPNGEGIYHIIEGQHRRHALEKYAAKINPETCGEEQAPCHVIASADPARAAEIWLGINTGRKNPRPVSEFRVAVTAKRDLEVAVNSAVERCGYHVREDSRSENVISAVSALRRVYTLYGEVVLVQTLNALRSIWSGDPHGVNGSLVRGFGRFHNEFGRYYDKRRLTSVIQEKYQTPFKFLEAAKAYKERVLEPIDEAVHELLLRAYNRGLPESRKLRRKGD